jgi:polysaccharide biosynthesis transport protein
VSTPPVEMQPGQAPARQATLRDFFAIIFRRRWLILGLFFVVTATVLVIALTTPTIYASSGRVLVTRGERESALSSHVQILNDWEQDLAGEVAKVRGTAVLDRARDLLVERAKRTHSTPLVVSERRVDVQVVGKSNVLGIGYDDLNPQTAQEVCDALLTAYVELRQEKPLGETENMLSLQLDSLRQQIEFKTALRESVATSTGVVDPVEMTRTWNGQLSELEGRQDEVAAELAEAQSVVKAMREQLKHPDADLPALGTDSQASEFALSQLKQRVTTQQANIATLRERYRDDSPEVLNAITTLETLQALMRREVRQRLTVAESRVDQLQARFGVHRRNLAGKQAQLDALPRNQKLIDGLDAEIKTLRARNEEYTRARDQARITANVSPGVKIVLLNPAGPAEPKNSLDLVRMLLAPGFSLVVGVGLAFFIDGLDLTVRTAGQAEAYLDLPVLATLPERRRRRG